MAVGSTLGSGPDELDGGGRRAVGSKHPGDDDTLGSGPGELDGGGRRAVGSKYSGTKRRRPSD